MRVLIFLLLFLSACQVEGGVFSGWLENIKEWKEYSITHLASQGADNSFTEEDREELLYLFGDLIRAGSCSQVHAYLEGNPVLALLEINLDLNRGFLFDVFVNNYNYEDSLLQISRTVEEQAAFSIVSVWKTEASLSEISEVVSIVAKCYPDEYL